MNGWMCVHRFNPTTVHVHDSTTSCSVPVINRLSFNITYSTLDFVGISLSAGSLVLFMIYVV